MIRYITLFLVLVFLTRALGCPPAMGWGWDSGHWEEKAERRKNRLKAMQPSTPLVSYPPRTTPKPLWRKFPSTLWGDRNQLRPLGKTRWAKPSTVYASRTSTIPSRNYGPRPLTPKPVFGSPEYYRKMSDSTSLMSSNTMPKRPKLPEPTTVRPRNRVYGCYDKKGYWTWCPEGNKIVYDKTRGQFWFKGWTDSRMPSQQPAMQGVNANYVGQRAREEIG